MKLQHEFEVPASPASTRAVLLDPERVVSCIPGAALVEIVEDGTWKTTMSVKLGPIGLDFLNDVRVVEQDEAAGTLRLSIRGRDRRGKGAADGTVDARMLPNESGGTKVTMDTDVRFSGQLAQLGRPSVIEDVSSRLVGEFAQSIRAKLDTAVDSRSAQREGGST